MAHSPADIPQDISGDVQQLGLAVPGVDVSIISMPPAGLVEAGSGTTNQAGHYSIVYRLDYRWPAFAIAISDYGEPWEASLVMGLGDLVHPATPNGFVYRAETAGTLAVTEPTWWADYTGQGTAQQIGTAILKAIQYLRPQVIGPITPEQLES